MLGNAGAMVQRLSGRRYRVSTDGNGAHPEIFRHQGWKPPARSWFSSAGLLGTPFATVEASAHRTPCSSLGSDMQPIAFTAEGLHLALCFAFNCGIRDQWAH